MSTVFPRRHLTPPLARVAKKLRGSALFSREHFRVLAKNVRALEEAGFLAAAKSRKGIPEPLREQPFDGIFLTASPLYRLSRTCFLAEGGSFEAKLTTSPRSLSSLILTENRIEYTPHATELFWALGQIPTSAAGGKNEAIARASKLITYSTSLFHEQNHRLLWKRIAPPAKLTRETLHQYLNFMESLVVVLDMALGDELGTGISALGYLSGTLYDPGTEVALASPRLYRNYLQLALQATFLALEGYEKKRVRKALLAPFTRKRADFGPDELPRAAAEHAIDRALRLDAQFIERTNPFWQAKYSGELMKLWKTHSSGTRGRQRSSRSGNTSIYIPSTDLLTWTNEYLVAERIFDEWGVSAFTSP